MATSGEVTGQLFELQVELAISFTKPYFCLKKLLHVKLWLLRFGRHFFSNDEKREPATNTVLIANGSSTASKQK